MGLPFLLPVTYTQARDWERSAPAEEQLTPPVQAELWRAALRTCRDRGEPITDAYGRELRLHRLPHDLLVLTDPRAVVLDSTRLPEDIEDWIRWVHEEQP